MFFAKNCLSNGLGSVNRTGLPAFDLNLQETGLYTNVLGLHQVGSITFKGIGFGAFYVRYPNCALQVFAVDPSGIWILHLHQNSQMPRIMQFFCENFGMDQWKTTRLKLWKFEHFSKLTLMIGRPLYSQILSLDFRSEDPELYLKNVLDPEHWLRLFLASRSSRSAFIVFLFVIRIMAAG